MLLWLADLLGQHYKGFGVFNYLTFRFMLSIVTAFALSLWWGPALIDKLKEMKFGQAIRTDGPQTHLAKTGTPTMGGALILLTIAVSTLAWGKLTNLYVWIVLGV